MGQHEQDIIDACDEIKALLLHKHTQYGDSVFSPMRIFSSAPALELVNARIDDKLSRIANATHKRFVDLEDAELDLIGYLILKRIIVKTQTTE